MKTISKKISTGILCSLLLSGCANMGAGPQGGPKDVTPPKYMGSTPKQYETNVDKKKVVVNFDEYIQLKDAYTQIVVSPPQKTQSSITSVGRKVTVELEDSLKPNTTYVIDFASAIADNNEGNEIKDFAITFSTGNVIDSMRIGGNLIDAATLAPMKGIYVGAYESSDDKVLGEKAMEHITKTDEKGHFVIKGLAEKPYRIFALKDDNNNYYFDQKSEGIAILGENITPTKSIELHTDTVYKDSVTIDTIKNYSVTKFEPDSLLMRYYLVENHIQQFKNAKRDRKGHVVAFMTNEKKEIPTVKLLNGNQQNWYKVESSETGDTTTYWITDSTVASMDTLKLAFSHEKTDSTGNFISACDTLNLVAPKEKKSRKKEVAVKFKLNNTVEIYDKPILEWNTPLRQFDKNKMKVEKKKDSTWTPIEFEIKEVENNPRKYAIELTMEEEEEYRAVVDSAMAVNIYGESNDERLKSEFKLRKKSEYTSLTLKISGAQNPAYVELMNSKESVIRHEKVVGSIVRFENLKAGDYYARLVEDTNNDDKWTTGNYEKMRKPENVYYYPQKFSLRANWDREEDWDVKKESTLKQRPSELNSDKKKK